MTTFIFTWNPEVWDRRNLLKLKTKLENGKDAVNQWRCHSHKIVKVGDRAFISRVGGGSTGIFASGFVVSLPYDFENERLVDIEFDYIIDPNESIYEISRLEKEISSKSKLWNPQSSGMPIPPELDSILERFWSEFISEKEVFKIENDKNIPETEKKALIRARIGQGRFRKDLVELWDGTCSVTGCSVTEILIASHIKRWVNSNNEERLDKFNGFLLTPNLDKLFDLGFISFSDDGKILISSKLSKKDKEILGVNEKMKLTEIHSANKKYLVHHRKTWEV